MLAHTKGNALNPTLALEKYLDSYTDPSVTVGIRIYLSVRLTYIFILQMDLVQCGNIPYSSRGMS